VCTTDLQTNNTRDRRVATLDLDLSAFDDGSEGSFVESTSSLTLLPAIPTFRTTLAPGISSLAREQDNTGTLAVTAQAPALAWGGHWAVQQSQPDYYIMEISGLIQPRSYDARTASSSALTRAIMAPQYVTSLPYSSSSSSASLVAPQHPMQQHHPFNPAQYAGAGSNSLVPAFNSNYIQQRPQVRMISSSAGLSRTLSYPGSSRQSGFVEEQQSPTIKSESPALSSNGATWNMHTPTTAAYTSTDKPPVPSSGEVGFRTEVDTLMKAIQSKAKQQPSGKPPQSAPIEQSKPAVGSLACVYVSPAGTSHGFLPEKEGKEQKQRLTEWDSQDEKPTSKKRYECEIPGCNKSFYQKTHLEIHIRAHTGVKPYACKTQGCNQRFSQLGNLKVRRQSPSRAGYFCLHVVSRLTNAVTPASDLTTARSVANVLPNEGMFAHIKLSMIRPSLLSVDSKTAASSSPN
jgi:hypothetical protein